MKKLISLKLAIALIAVSFGMQNSAHAQKGPDKGAQILVAYGVAVALMIWAAGSNKSHAAEPVRFDIDAKSSADLKAELGETSYFSLLNEMAIGSSSAVLSQKYSSSQSAQTLLSQYSKATGY